MRGTASVVYTVSVECSSFASGTINAGNSCWLGILLALNRFIITLPGMPSDLLPNCERYLQAGCCQGS